MAGERSSASASVQSRARVVKGREPNPKLGIEATVSAVEEGGEHAEE